MTIGTPLHRATLDRKYDAIIIGSGIGGLTAAACLGMAGKKVLVLEQHYTAGGFTHTYQRKGFEWDVGVHYVGGAHHKGTVTEKIFNEVGCGEIQWQPMGEVYDRIYLGEKPYDYVAGKDAFFEKMVSYFPNEKDAIAEYLRLIKDVTRKSALFYMNKSLPNLISQFAGNMLSSGFFKYSDRLTGDVLRELTNNKAQKVA